MPAVSDPVIVDVDAPELGVEVDLEDMRAPDGTPSPLGNGVQRRSFQYIYWHKPELSEPDQYGETTGEVEVGPSWPPEAMDLMEMGWTPMKKFGGFHPDNPKEPGGAWYLERDRYRRILQHPEGPREFPLRQILEQGWHRRAPKANPAATFPQFKSAAFRAHKDLGCDICGRKFLSRANLDAHQTIAHQEQSSNEKLARTMVGMQSESSGAIGQALTMLATSLDRQAARLEAAEARAQETDQTIAAMLEALVKLSGGPAKK